MVYLFHCLLNCRFDQWAPGSDCSNRNSNWKLSRYLYGMSRAIWTRICCDFCGASVWLWNYKKAFDQNWAVSKPQQSANHVHNSCGVLYAHHLLSIVLLVILASKYPTKSDMPTICYKVLDLKRYYPIFLLGFSFLVSCFNNFISGRFFRLPCVTRDETCRYIWKSRLLFTKALLTWSCGNEKECIYIWYISFTFYDNDLSFYQF